MTVQQSDRRDTDRVLEKEIVRYLRNHPEFFEAHLDLLADMVLPHQSYGTVSLIERQVSVLREQKDELRKRLNRLMETARLNEKLNERINAFILDLLDAQTLDEILTVVRSRLTDDFAADAVVVRLFKPADAAMASRPEFVDWSEPVLGAFENVIRDRKPVCGKLKPGQLDTASNFRNEFMTRGDPTDPRNRSRLRELLGQVMIRNTRALARVDIPPRFARTIKVEPRPLELDLYQRISALAIDITATNGSGHRLERLAQLITWLSRVVKKPSAGKAVSRPMGSIVRSGATKGKLACSRPAWCYRLG